MICKIRLRAIYRSNPEVRTFCGMIAALALLPENDVHLRLENLKEIADEMRTIPLIEYVERVYVGSEGTTGPTTCVKDGITNSTGLLGIHILLRGTS